MTTMEIKETPLFTKRVLELLDDDDYALLQAALVMNPQLGNVIVGTGGIRKVRWGGSDRGKRGGTRIIYFAALAHDTILMLYIYPKNEQEDLSVAQKKALQEVVRAEYR
jgi:mRNA-degrading endonuclease RelE of RelBE toxin-antitoxin system